MLEITNEGPAIVSTNYWETDFAEAGAVYLSVNAGTFRLLLPDRLNPALNNMRTAREVIISRGPWPAQRRTDAIEILFDDGSASPYVIHIGLEQIDRLPFDSDAGRSSECTVWTRGPKLELSLPARYRRSVKLPDLSPWSKGD